MATTFEIVISAQDADQLYAGQAAHALFAEIDRLEDELSRFRPGSDVFYLSQLKAGSPPTSDWPPGIASASPNRSMRKRTGPLTSPSAH